MSQIDLESVSRFIDGEASEENRLVVREDRQAMAEAERLRRQDALLRDWFDRASAAPAPESLERAVRQGFRIRRTRQALSRWLVPAAAAAIVVVAGLAGFDRAIDRRVDRALEQMRAERASDLALLASAVQDVLEDQPSGSEVRFQNAATGFEVTLVPRRTWKSASGHWCREFVEIFESTSTETAPVSTACRTPDGRWVRVRTEIPAPGTPILPDRAREL